MGHEAQGQGTQDLTVRHLPKRSPTIRPALKTNPYTPLQLQRAREQGRDGSWAGVGDAWTYLTLIISGVVVWGGAGMLLDAWVGTKPVFTIVGALIGNFVGIYGAYVRAFRESEDGTHAA